MSCWASSNNKLKYKRALTDEAFYRHKLNAKMTNIKIALLTSWSITLISVYITFRYLNG